MYLGLTQYLETCPQLAGQVFNFDFIKEEAASYSVVLPNNIPEISKDTLGNSRCTLVFQINSVELFGEDIANNISNLDFLQKIKKWFEKQNRKKKFPDFGEDKEVLGVYATTDGYIDETTPSTGRYQLQCKVEYIQKNTNPNKLPLKF